MEVVGGIALSKSVTLSGSPPLQTIAAGHYYSASDDGDERPRETQWLVVHDPYLPGGRSGR